MADTLINQLLTGSILSGNSDQNAQDSLKKLTGAYDGITAPTLTPEQLQNYQWLGDLQPSAVNSGADVQADPVQAAQAATALAGPSAMDGVKNDPSLLSQEQASLGALKDLADRGGLNQADMANLNRIQDQAAQASRGQQDAIMQNMAARGMGGSGNELLARLSASQNATNQVAQQGLDIAGQAQSRALQAMMQGGSLASQLQGQQFNEAAQKAAAADAIAKFNAQNANTTNYRNADATDRANEFNSNQRVGTAMANRNTDIGVQGRNADINNQAAYYNSEGRQNLANQNTNLANQQTIYNTQQLPQQNFNNQMGVAGAKAGVAGAGVNYWNNQSGQERQGFQNLAQGAIGMGTGAASNYAQTGSAFTNAGDAANMSKATGRSWNTDSGSLNNYAHGGFVPGVAKVPGNSLANDTVSAHLSPGEVVLPRSVTQSAHPIKAATSFLKHQPIGSSKFKPEDLGHLLKSLNPKHQLNSETYREQEEAEGDDDGISSKLAALGLLSK